MAGTNISHKIMGPNGNWWIDEEGNMFIKGSLVVEKGIDPTFFTCVSQGSATTNNTVVVVSNVLDYRNNVGTTQAVQLSALPDSAVATTDTDVSQTTSGLVTNQVTTDSMVVDSASNKVWIIAGFVWAKEADEQQGGSISGTISVTPVDISTTTSTNGSIGGTVFQHVHSPGSTGTKTYNINASKDDPQTAKMFGASVALVECN